MNKAGLAFTNQFGLPTHRNAIRRDLHAALRKPGLPHPLPRFASLLCDPEAGRRHAPKVVQEHLAHAMVSSTLDLYAHVMPSTRLEAADSLAALLD
jgi:integrase